MASTAGLTQRYGAMVTLDMVRTSGAEDTAPREGSSCKKFRSVRPNRTYASVANRRGTRPWLGGYQCCSSSGSVVSQRPRWGAATGRRPPGTRFSSVVDSEFGPDQFADLEGGTFGLEGALH